MNNIVTRISTDTKGTFSINPDATEAAAAAQAKIVKNVSEARKLLDEADALAKEYRLPFEVAIMTGGSYQDTYWASSEDCYGELL